jgi:predicted 3-demethylubiquinone-9 3-methyltransferase (glyoxalase superfamily)
MLKTLEICYDVAIEKKNFGWALKFAIKLDNRDKIERVFNECTDNTVKL